jgi:signal transduction histidine kinase
MDRQPLAAPRVLYIDDDPALARLVQRNLARHGFTAEVASNGTEGLERAVRGGVDAIALDHHMPGQDGLATLRALRDLPACPPIVYVTGSDDLRIAVAALKGGAVDFVLKDVQGEFMNLLREALLRALEAAGLRREVERTQEELGRLNRALERRVEERTQELRAANVRLREQMVERERIEARLFQAQKLEALGQLAGGVAHDFNNVLQAVLGGTRLIERRSADSAAVGRLAAMVLEAAERGAAVTRRLLAFARRDELRAEAVDTRDLLAGLREMLAHTLSSGVEVRVDAPAGLPQVRADRGQLETALVNLATNARDAMAPRRGGALTIRAASEEVAAGAAHPAGLMPGAYVRLTVADEGVGMDVATLARATEPFFTTKPRGRGTGLGLAMVKGFAEQSGGALDMESAPEHGTVASLWLPQTEGATMAAMPGASEGDRGETAARPTELSLIPARPVARVLLVDDETAVRAVLAEGLADCGFDVVEAENGAAALARLDAGGRFDLLITDLTMPRMDGLTLILEARVRVPALPALLVTGDASAASASETLLDSATRSGPLKLLQKPIWLDDLTQQAALLLGSGSKSEVVDHGQGIPRAEP